MFKTYKNGCSTYMETFHLQFFVEVLWIIKHSENLNPLSKSSPRGADPVVHLLLPKISMGNANLHINQPSALLNWICTIAHCDQMGRVLEDLWNKFPYKSKPNCLGDFFGYFEKHPF